MQNLDELSSEILSAVEAADTTDALEAVRIDALGKKGRISLMMRELGGMDPEERKTAGQTLNTVKDTIATAIETRQAALSRIALDARPRIKRNARQRRLTGFDGGGDSVLDRVQRLTGGLALFRVHAAELTHHQRDAAFLAKRVDAHGFQRVGGVRGLDRTQDFR